MAKSRAMFAALALLLAALALTLVIPFWSNGVTPEPEGSLKPVAFNLTPYENNPILTRGATGLWDVESVFSAHVVFKDGSYHMFYSGSSGPTLQPVAIGYATSPDGFSFTKHASNPILEADGSGFDAVQVIEGVPLAVGDTWMLYYNAGSQPGPGPAIGRAMAPTPSGPWTRSSDPVLTSGGLGEWDAGFVMPNSVVTTDEGYVMYYAGGAGWPSGSSAIGMATSADGLAWTKYNDPATENTSFAESDPVLQVGSADSWDSSAVWGCAVRQVAGGWEMFYTGSDSKRVRIGYATSTDGVQWTKYEGNPILASEADPLGKKIELPILQAPSVVVNDSTYILYYDYGISAGSIGVATGTITREPAQ